jgi:ribose/xylose/arabinose/galactoside ABC-type transport system permease subunit
MTASDKAESPRIKSQKVVYGLIDNSVWVLLGLGVAIFIILKPQYFNPFVNIQLYWNIPMQAAVMGVLTVGIAGTILLGDIDLSLVGMMGLSAAVGALIYKDLFVPNGVPGIVAFLIIIAVGTLFGFINGVLIAKLKAVSLIETLAMNTTLTGVVLAVTKGRSIMLPNADYTWIGQTKFFNNTIPLLAILLAAVYVIMYFVWRRTALGRSFYAVGGNMHCARVSGINVDRIRIAAFTISGTCAGLAGVMLSSKMGSLNSTFGQNYSMDIIAAAVIGGTSLQGGVGKITGVLGGVLLLNFIQVGLQVLGLDAYYVQMGTGLIILLAVLIDSMRIRFQSKG